jgi:prophage antirepressor-like protein
MNQVIPFNFENHAVRTVMIEQTPWLVARDVCDVLEIKNVSQTLQTKRIDPKGREYLNFPENEKADIDLIYISSNGTRQSRKTLCVNEPGLYRLVFQSRKPEAERFKTLVFNEILPQIRRTGMYVPDDVKDVIKKIPLSDAIPAIETAMRQDGCSINTIWLVMGIVETLLSFIETCHATILLREENDRLRRRYICTPDDKREILHLHKDGFNVSQIAYKTKKGKTRIKNVIAEAEAVNQPDLFGGEPSGGPLVDATSRGHDGGGL